jgi:hypothetical protein
MLAARYCQTATTFITHLNIFLLIAHGCASVQAYTGNIWGCLGESTGFRGISRFAGSVDT